MYVYTNKSYGMKSVWLINTSIVSIFFLNYENNFLSSFKRLFLIEKISKLILNTPFNH